MGAWSLGVEGCGQPVSFQRRPTASRDRFKKRILTMPVRSDVIFASNCVFGLQLTDFTAVLINTKDLMAKLRKAGTGYKSDIPCPNDGYFHL